MFDGLLLGCLRNILRFFLVKFRVSPVLLWFEETNLTACIEVSSIDSVSVFVTIWFDLLCVCFLVSFNFPRVDCQFNFVCIDLLLLGD